MYLTNYLKIAHVELTYYIRKSGEVGFIVTSH